MQLTILRARRQIYKRGKRLLWVQLSLTLVVPVLGSILALIVPQTRALLALVSIIIAGIDATVLERAQRTIRRNAAKAAEEFDCTVLELPWDKFVVGDRLAPEFVYAAAQRCGDDSTVFNWYPPIVGSVALHFARIICQRTNLWYDSTLRRQYGRMVIGGVIVLCVFLLSIGVLSGLTLETFVLTVLAPATPFSIWGIKEFNRQNDAASTTSKLMTEAEALWERAKQGLCSAAECTVSSRQFQNAIFDRRSSDPLIIDWVYWLQRNSLEDQMNRGAERFVEEVKGNTRAPRPIESLET